MASPSFESNVRIRPPRRRPPLSTTDSSENGVRQRVPASDDQQKHDRGALSSRREHPDLLTIRSGQFDVVQFRVTRAAREVRGALGEPNDVVPGVERHRRTHGRAENPPG